MKKSFIYIILIVIIIFAGIFLVTKTNKQDLASKNIENDSNENINQYYENILNEISNNEFQEKELSIFSTPLAGDEARLHNIELSCNTINGTKLKNGETFSFNDLIGEPTQEKGYMEADVIVGTKLTKGVGGGNCQVSTTLYNACLSIQGIEIVERHPHKRKVTYVEEGKDASVSYGTLDLKFKNNTGKDITIYMKSEENQVTARIVTF